MCKCRWRVLGRSRCDEWCAPGECPRSHIIYMCINGRSEIQKCFVKIFADDTTVYTAAQSEEQCRLMQNSTDQLVQWTK